MTMKEMTGGERPRIARFGTIITDVDVATSESSCSELPTINFAGGSVEVPTGSSVTTLELYASHTKGGTHVEAHDTDGNTISITVSAGGVYSLPAEIFDYPYMKLVADASGTVSVFLKG